MPPESDAPAEHRDAAPASVRCAVLTISDTRTLETDTSGTTIVQQLTEHGHVVAERVLMPDEPDQIRACLERLRASGEVDAVLITGGTGISPRDQTYECVSALLTKPMPGFGELFRMLSYAEIGAAAALSRAIGGLAGRMVVLVMPGSRGAVRLALERIILPELGHMVREANK